MNAQRWSRVLGTLAVVALLAFATVLSSLSGAEGGRPASSRSNAEDGRRAIRLLASEIGFDARVWRRRPAELPRERTLFVLADVPRAAESPDDPLVAARATGPHDPHYYRRFVDEGGVLALPATVAAVTWLTAGLAIDACAEVTLDPGQKEASENARATSVTIPGRPETFDVRLTWCPIDPGGAPHDVLLTAADGTRLALRIPVGRGAVALLPPGEFLRNDSIGVAEHGLLWVRLIEALAPDRSVWFDEYALGDQERDSAVSLSFSPALSILTWHVLAFALVALWRGAWPRPFPRTSDPRGPVEPLARVRGQAAWFVRGRRSELLARELRRAAWADLVRRYGVRAARSEVGQAPDEAQVRALAERAGATDVEAWVALFSARPPRAGIDLERLACELAELDSAQAAHGESEPGH